MSNACPALEGYPDCHPDDSDLSTRSFVKEDPFPRDAVGAEDRGIRRHNFFSKGRVGEEAGQLGRPCPSGVINSACG